MCVCMCACICSGEENRVVASKATWPVTVIVWLVSANHFHHITDFTLVWKMTHSHSSCFPNNKFYSLKQTVCWKPSASILCLNNKWQCQNQKLLFKNKRILAIPTNDLHTTLGEWCSDKTSAQRERALTMCAKARYWSWIWRLLCCCQSMTAMDAEALCAEDRQAVRHFS